MKGIFGIKERTFILKKQRVKFAGADTENRTRDLTLTKGALYQLSHISSEFNKYIEREAWQ